MISYFEKQLKEIENSIHSIDEKVFLRWVDDAVDVLKKGHKIIVSGLGKNVPICDKFVGSMISMGLEAAFLHTNSAVHGDMGLIRDGDMVVVLTKSGATAESVYLVNQIHGRDISLWLVTFEADSVLAKTIDNVIVLKLKHEGDLWNIMPNNSTTINLIVLQGLAMQIAKKMDLKLEDFKRNHPGGHIGEVLSDGR